MRTATDAVTVEQAELRASQAVKDFYCSWKRVRLASRSAMTRPSSLLMVSAAIGLLGFRLVRSNKSSSNPAPKALNQAKPSILVLLLALMGRYGVQWLISSALLRMTNTGVAGGGRSNPSLPPRAADGSLPLEGK